MPQSGTQHTTMPDKVRIALCKYKKENPHLSQKALIQWLHDNHGIKVSQATISITLKQSVELLSKPDDANLDAKCQRSVKYPEMESALVDFFKANQEHVNLSGDLIKENAGQILDHLYPGHELFEFSNG